jgi:NAD(P)-dependent dehydrogenase (short-subunit alcohol dehydrogenase family)
MRSVSRDLFDLTGTFSVVTGSSRGIGLAIAHALLHQNGSVLVNGFDPAETDDAVRFLRESHPDPTDGPPRVAGLAGDVTDPDFAQALVNDAVTTFGRLDHLVSNAGIDIIKPAIDYTPQEWDRILAVTSAAPSRPRRLPRDTGSHRGAAARSR